MKLTVALEVLIGTLLLACSTAALPPVEPTPNIDATVEAKLDQERAVESTVEARLKEEKTSQARAQAQSASTELPGTTYTPLPQPTNTPTLAPTHTPRTLPTATVTPASPLIPVHTPTPTIQSMVRETRPSVVYIETNLGTGSGFIYQQGFPNPGDDKSGLVITNFHVVENEDWINVTVKDSNVYRGSILGADIENDLAIVKICCGDFSPLKFGDSAVGDRVIAMGYPLGINDRASITTGIVSAIRHDNGQWVVQTDAAINPGNSGGPLLSIAGQVIGVNTYKLQDTEGMGFAVGRRTIQSLIPVLSSGLPFYTPTPPPTATPTPLSHIENGQNFYDFGLYDKAIFEFTKALEIDVDNALAYVWRAHSHFALGDYRTALKDSAVALAYDPDNDYLNLRRMRGISQINLGIFQSAIVEYQIVISKDPLVTADDYYNRGFAYYSTDQFWKAIQDFNQAILIEPTPALYELRGISYYETGSAVLEDQYWKAVSDFDLAIGWEPTGNLYAWRAATYYALGLDWLADSDVLSACFFDRYYC